MPYIKQSDRELLDEENRGALTAGELNYLLTRCIDEYLGDHGLSYQTCNDIVGALENCKLEFVRRIVSPYEDTKIKERGDVY